MVDYSPQILASEEKASTHEQPTVSTGQQLTSPIVCCVQELAVAIRDSR